jgi:uridine kinase
MIVHPWIVIVHGAHGSGKSSLAAKLLSQLLENIVYEEVDKSFEFRSNIGAFVDSLVTQKQQHPDAIKLTVLENAEVIQDFNSTTPLIDLVQTTTHLIEQKHSVTARLIILTSSFQCPWIRSLRDNCSVSVISIDPVVHVPT